SLNTCGQVQTYVFTAHVGDRVVINMSKEAGNVNPTLDLYGPDGRALELSAAGTIDRVVTSGGEFTLLAYSKVDETGNYRLRLNTLRPSIARAEIAWRHTGTGGVATWLVSGPSILDARMLTAVPPEWEIAAVADVNGDGRVDLVWRHPTGAVAVW